MLDTSTKRRIDTARDILVGKVPDPKSQVEQITIALIYKFMDDMDAEAEELGGHRKFFAGEYARYGWAKLMHSSMGGHETLSLYAEAISKMPENPGIPVLFRDIFKNAYLPYRDPETLKAFLKIIDEFTYDHSERLGDAFEYLLSVLGSQGDAGQFRTPRHIIDFMVAVLDPKKNETVLDPACGTAGFLISSYKHILKLNVDKHGNSTLTPDDRERLAKNFLGYDISPDMVRLSLVNLYLHGFTDPHIHEYDSLTSQDRWNEHADVILANPPFMSPKGGIKPHNRFSVQSKRSEVLFVDYMAEHLTPNGRAGIIVPEGIIFQSQTAYKQLRKMLVDDFLVAVVSLPAGVFQPYSGVKTSILLLDKSLARRADSIAFIKVENDGFGLGAQRREIDKNDLPAAAAFLKSWLPSIQSQASIESTPNALLVPKEKIAANGDYNLSGERYREGTVSTASWPIVPLSEIIDELESGVSVNSTNRPAESGEMGILKTSCVTSGFFSPEENKAVLPDELSRLRCPVRKNSIIISRMNTEALVGANAYIEKDYGHLFLPDRLWQTVISRSDVMVPYVQYVLGSRDYRDRISATCGGTSGSMKNITKPQLLSLQIPLPPLEVQKEIVAEIEGYQKVIDGARAVLDNYRPHIPIDPEWPMVELGEVCRFKRGPFGGSLKKEIFVKNGYAVYEQSHAIANDFSHFRYFVEKDKFDEMQGFQVHPGELIMSCSGTMGKMAIIPKNAPAGIINQALLKLTPTNQVSGTFLNLWMESENFQRSLSGFTYGAAIKNVASVEVLKGLQLPLPPLATQQAIVVEIEAEQALVSANRELITRFELKIQTTLARVWGEATEGCVN